MNPKERLDAFVDGRSYDRPPNLTIVGSYVTQYTGIGVDTYCLNARAMLEAAVRCAEDAALDYIQIASDLQREAEGFGTRLTFHPDKLPTVAAPCIPDTGAIARLKPLDPLAVPRLAALVEAVALTPRYNDAIYPMTAVVGPATVAGNMCGVEDFLLYLYDEPEAVEALLDVVTETALAFVDALAQAGARYLYVPDPVASLFSPDAYETFLLPRHRRLYDHMEARGIHRRLHMCGNTERLLPLTSQSGAEIIDIDHAVHFPTAMQRVEGRCRLAGNIDPVADVFSATPEHTRQAILACAAEAGETRALFMPGCELPTATPRDNVLAIAAALAEIGAAQ